MVKGSCVSSEFRMTLSLKREILFPSPRTSFSPQYYTEKKYILIIVIIINNHLTMRVISIPLYL